MGTSPDRPDLVRSPAERTAAAIDAFGRDLYARAAADTPGNLFLSPLSVHAAMAMALAGAGGRTAAQLAAALHWPTARDDEAAYADLLPDAVTATSGRSRRLVVANALWVREGHPPLPQYVRRIARHFGGSAVELDFDRAAAAADAVNAWVERHTNKKIRQLVSPASFGPLARLILTNAVYFRADWRDKFDPADTAEAPFHLAGGGSVRVPMMHQSGYFHAADAGRHLLIDLRYADYSMSMRVFVPKDPADLPRLEREVLATAGSRGADGDDGALPWRPVELFLPRFRFESLLPLARTLVAMGAADAFDVAAADFTGIAGAGDFWLSDVIHKAYVDVNEEGTEAAGATAAALAGGAGPEPDTPLTVRVDRPFLFTIRNWSMSSGAKVLLFIGRVMDPTR